MGSGVFRALRNLKNELVEGVFFGIVRALEGERLSLELASDLEDSD